ncbi:hypothetical protein BKA93DRAFT_344932 [Sparassis latifolia]
MPFFHHEGEEARAHAQVTGSHQAHLSHEVIAAAASYEAAKAYEKHCEANGKPANHKEATELLAALTGGFIDRLVETRGLDFIDKEKAKRDAHHRAQTGLSNAGEY